jgi:hypothetical protein
LATALSGSARLAPPVAALIDGFQHLQLFKAQLLALATHVEGHEMAQVLEGDLTAQLQLEGGGTAAVSSRLLPHLHHKVAGFRTGEDQLSPHGEIVVAFRESIVGLGRCGGVL